MDLPLQILYGTHRKNRSNCSTIEVKHRPEQNRIIKFEGRRELMYLPLKHTVPFQNKKLFRFKVDQVFLLFSLVDGFTDEV